MKNSLIAALAAVATAASGLPAIAGTATNSWEEGTKTHNTNLNENGTFLREGTSNFSYTRNGSVVDNVSKDSLTIDGVVVFGAVGGIIPPFGGFVAGAGADDFDISLISSSTSDVYDYSIIADASSSYSESGDFSLTDNKTSTSDFKIHTLSTDTGAGL